MPFTEPSRFSPAFFTRVFHPRGAAFLPRDLRVISRGVNISSLFSSTAQVTFVVLTCFSHCLSCCSVFRPKTRETPSMNRTCKTCVKVKPARREDIGTVWLEKI